MTIEEATVHMCMAPNASVEVLQEIEWKLQTKGTMSTNALKEVPPHAPEQLSVKYY